MKCSWSSVLWLNIIAGFMSQANGSCDSFFFRPLMKYVKFVFFLQEFLTVMIIWQMTNRRRINYGLIIFFAPFNAWLADVTGQLLWKPSSLYVLQWSTIFLSFYSLPIRSFQGEAATFPRTWWYKVHVPIAHLQHHQLIWRENLNWMWFCFLDISWIRQGFRLHADAPAANQYERILKYSSHPSLNVALRIARPWGFPNHCPGTWLGRMGAPASQPTSWLGS